MIKVGGYILGEFGNLIAGDVRSRYVQGVCVDGVCVCGVVCVRGVCGVGCLEGVCVKEMC